MLDGKKTVRQIAEEIYEDYKKYDDVIYSEIERDVLDFIYELKSYEFIC